MGRMYSDEKIITIIKEVDAKKDGTITFDEFQILMAEKAIIDKI